MTTNLIENFSWYALTWLRIISSNSYEAVTSPTKFYLNQNKAMENSNEIPVHYIIMCIWKSRTVHIVVAGANGRTKYVCRSSSWSSFYQFEGVLPPLASKPIDLHSIAWSFFTAAVSYCSSALTRSVYSTMWAVLRITPIVYIYCHLQRCLRFLTSSLLLKCGNYLSFLIYLNKSLMKVSCFGRPKIILFDWCR